eukprot:gnl/MRDRNA2_/MRDRNA2_89422_c0_seq1.p1 gnl/MRDRNA2_/MRDRNA2_89422_c0~~gnl/MRDRNA2_/MRDRNA2_89422_c0_seq1.p1  ORF type:complete len:377 (+),score=123.38 gnl/MRDRNA2_/MRDRNA2_89422_c0_seq1:68-1198(+)
MALRSACLLLFASLAATQDVNQLEEQLTQEDGKLSQALKSATYWKTIGQSKRDELAEVLKAQKFAQGANLGSFGSSDATAASRLAACLRTRDAAALETEKLQQETASLAAQVEAAQRDRSLANETSLRRIAECEAKANQTMTESATEAAKLQTNLDALKSEHSQLQNSLKTAESDNQALNAKVAAMQKEHKRQLEEIANQGELELAKLKNQDAKVLEAHHVLQKAHEVLQKRHQELQDQSKKNNEKQASEFQRMRNDLQTCQQDLVAAKQSEAELRKKQEKQLTSAMMKGAEQTRVQFQAALKNATDTKSDLEAKIKEAEALVAQKEALAKEARKDVPDMELKLRRCRESREKTELDYQNILKRCPQKGVFLQQWP